jgi:hypothetical protein
MASLPILHQVEDHLLTRRFPRLHHRLPTSSGNLIGLDGSKHIGRQHRCRCKGGDALQVALRAFDRERRDWNNDPTIPQLVVLTRLAALSWPSSWQRCVAM